MYMVFVFTGGVWGGQRVTPCAVPTTGATKSRCLKCAALKTRPAFGDCLKEQQSKKGAIDLSSFAFFVHCFYF